MPTVVFEEALGIERDQILAAFKAAQIDARVFFYPLSAQPMFKPVQENANAWSICERAINLPSFHDMTDDDIARVSQVIRSLVTA
jgi:perosamine synthetase